MYTSLHTLATCWRQRLVALRQDPGATVIEYALMALGGIAIAAILVAAITAFTRDHANAIKTSTP